ncbi:MAG: sensor histidine kinase [Hyphomicrobiales bacterium]
MDGDPSGIEDDTQDRVLLQSLIDSATCLLTFDEAGTILEARNIGFAAERFSLLPDMPDAIVSDREAIGRSIEEVWPEGLLPITQIVTHRAQSSDGREASLEHTLADTNRNPIHLKLRAGVSGEGPDKRFHLSVADITASRMQAIQVEAYGRNLTEANTRLRLALNGSKVTVFEQDLDLRYTFMANPPDIFVETPLGKSDLELFSETGNELVELKRSTALSGKEWTGRIDVPDQDGGTVSYDVELEPRYSARGDVIGLIGTAIDLSDLKKYEDAMRLAMREITHRTKNLLAVIQATARRTAAKAPTKEAFVNSFAARLSAMSQSHDLLVRSNWRGADLAELVERNASQAGSTLEGSFRIEGPPLTLTSDAAQHFGMALHELVSNALKYGALSVEGGTVEAMWEQAGENVVFRWTESGGPEVLPPDSTGFGTSYLQRAIAMALNAKTDLDFDPAGLKCTITMPGECFY